MITDQMTTTSVQVLRQNGAGTKRDAVAQHVHELAKARIEARVRALDPDYVYPSYGQGNDWGVHLERVPDYPAKLEREHLIAHAECGQGWDAKHDTASKRLHSLGRDDMADVIKALRAEEKAAAEAAA